jgi:hypothetical protein
MCFVQHPLECKVHGVTMSPSKGDARICKLPAQRLLDLDDPYWLQYVVRFDPILYLIKRNI